MGGGFTISITVMKEQIGGYLRYFDKHGQPCIRTSME